MRNSQSFAQVRKKAKVTKNESEKHRHRRNVASYHFISPLRKLQPPNGHCQNGGGLNACQDGLGHLIREELSKFKGAFASFWGV